MMTTSNFLMQRCVNVTPQESNVYDTYDICPFGSDYNSNITGNVVDIVYHLEEEKASNMQQWREEKAGKPNETTAERNARVAAIRRMQSTPQRTLPPSQSIAEDMDF